MLRAASVPHSASFHVAVIASGGRGKGQALGSHRWYHLCSTLDVADVWTIVPSALMKRLEFIDMNLPLNMDDVELSIESNPFCSWKTATSWKQASSVIGQANLLLCRAHFTLLVDSSGDN
jgi:hypothetical protein